MQMPSADLDAALAYLLERITEQAARSGAPLKEGEQYLLAHLPNSPTNPTVSYGLNFTYEGSQATPVLRDFTFERLCDLAREARHHDLEIRPEAAREWQFATAVVQFHRHPMSWLLGWADIRVAQPRPKWDRSLLITSAILLIAAFLSVAAGISILTANKSVAVIWTVWILGGCVYVGMIVLGYFGLKRLEISHWKQTLENYRCNLPVRSRANT